MGNHASNKPAGGDGSARTDHEARLQAIVDSAMDAIITVDDSQRIIMFNLAAERIFGVPSAEALGSPIDRFIPSRFRKAHAEHIRGFGRTGVTMRAMGRLGTLSGLRADGTEFPIEASVSQSLIDGQRLFTVILRDITRRRQLEEQLLQAQKMEGIGRLAGGIAHDFNNLLMAVFNYLTLATNRLEPDHPARAHLTHVHEAANRAATLTRQLLLFARKQPASPRVLSPRAVVAGLEPMLRRLIGDDLVLKSTLDPDTGHVRADPIQIEQIVMNLVVNARDAMPKGGTIEIRTSNIDLDGAHCADHADTEPGPFVAITVTDTGVGMSPEVLDRLFEPFFTTKDPGKGTGLGLATCHGIVRQSGGHIAVESAPGRGTTFRVMLPRVQEAPVAPPDVGTHALPVVRGETILLVEDSALVRDLIAEALRASGYIVLAASGGEQALELARSCLGPIHLLLTDILMPGMSGPRLAEALQQVRGPLHVLFISGGGDESLGDHLVDTNNLVLLTKPFTTDVLLRRIRAILDARAEK